MATDGPAQEALPDGLLIERSRVDPEAFAAVFDRHAAEIYRYLSRRAGASAADDLTAETFLVAFRERARYDGSRPDARPWLYGIATNMLRGHHRAEVRRFRALAKGEADPIVQHDADGVLDRVAAGQAGRRLAAALARLSAGERDALLLFAWQDLGYAEIAAALGIPIGTVRSRLSSARKRLRTSLADLDPAHFPDLYTETDPS
ncbi:RNA polymerase sigma factor [Phytohabitans sp. LJ34]|uniref:RNA polymerase sigma factor n=1 Tax=Phytohabitans sp. LJ34 TaxID=3452217 RepID=UPI003F8A4397